LINIDIYLSQSRRPTSNIDKTLSAATEIIPELFDIEFQQGALLFAWFDFPLPKAYSFHLQRGLAVGSINYSQAIRPDTAHIKKIIESSLLADWAIRIEYECGESHVADWRAWGEICFAIASAKPVLDALLDCYTSHPKSTIRIHAERFCTQTRLLYTVYDPQYLTAETGLRTETATRQPPEIGARKDQRGLFL